jgi:hypothetical protein
MTNNLFALLQMGEVHIVQMTQAVNADIGRDFVESGETLLEGKELILFDGNYAIDEDQLLYVRMDLPEPIKEAVKDAIGLPPLDLKEDKIRALFWYQNKKYYFQNFDKRKVLSNKRILVYNRQTFDRLREDAFIVDDTVNAVYQNGQFIFASYANANRILDLTEFYVEATNDDLEKFAGHRIIAIEDQAWWLENANTVIRKQVTLIEKSNILKSADGKKIKKSAKGFVDIELDDKLRVVFPRDKKVCRDILQFLNEQYYVGLITGKHFRTNSKRPA